jgi:hypothetical protein
MGIGRFFQSMFDSRVCGQEIIATQQKMYEQSRRENPGDEPHAHLARVWLSRARLHSKNPNDPTVQMVSFTETMQFACIPYPGCVRALGLYIVYKERPDIIQQYPEFAEEFAALIEPVQATMLDGTMMTLYARQNPRMAAKMDNE